ncbi:muscarinic acetylcholine receptor M2-like [Patiria miniata]|uniref:G-protein coupled receptors family 1 profile domain-containing protein n=1 Tax=Patiria miniata TaxID=46514 RepID=A0A914AB83_PATMI|nr:muscarinic acetylcholine receptor M2-like [Patiria miniata]
MSTSFPSHSFSTTSESSSTFSSLHSSHPPWKSLPFNTTDAVYTDPLEVTRDSMINTFASVVPTTGNSAPYLPRSVQVVMAAVVSCVVFLTIVANILVILSFCRYKQLRGFNQYFILSLAVSDLLVGCVDMPLYGVVFILGYWPFGEIFCDIFVFCDHTFSHFSVVSAVVISLDRFVALTKPFFHRHTWRTKRNAALLITLTYLVPVLIWLPITVLWPVFAGGRNVQTNTCQPQYVHSLVVSILAPVIFFWLPVTVVIVLYYHVHRSIDNTLGIMKKRKTEQMLGLRSAVSRCAETSAGERFSAMTAPIGDLTVPPAGISDKERSQQEPLGNLIKPKSKTSFREVSVVGLENVGFSVAASKEGEDQTTEEMKCQSLRGLPRFDSENRNINEPTVRHNGAPTFLEADPENLAHNQAAAIAESDSPGPNETSSRKEAPATASGTARASEVRSRTENTRATRMLSLIIAALIITWLPWAVLVIVINICQDCLPEFLYAVSFVSVFLGYMNSTLNPFCYAIADRRFRRAFREILRHPCGASPGPDPYSINYSANGVDGPVK